MRTAMGVAVALFLGCVARAGEDLPGLPPAPVVGDQRVFGSLDPLEDGSPDTDDLRRVLLPGDRLSAVLRPAPGSPLLPDPSLLDPAGAFVAAPWRAVGGAMVLRDLVADRPGPWTVRVGGRDGTQGGYLLRMRVRSARGRRAERGALGGGGAASVAIPLAGTTGALLSLHLRGRGGDPPPRAVALLGPLGAADGRFLPSLEAVGGGLRLRSLPLVGGSGTYRLLLEAPDPARETSYLLTVRLATPPLPSGDLQLEAVEPRLATSTDTVTGPPGVPLRIAGSGFAPSPGPRILMGGAEALLLAVAADGSHADVLAPSLPGGALVTLVVVNPDGQGDRRCDGYRHPLPAGVRLAGLLPPGVDVEAGGAVTVTVELDGPAPPPGVAVSLRVEPALASAPPTVVVPAHQYRAEFVLKGGPTPGEGRLRAEAGRVLEVGVRVRPAPPPPSRTLDLSGWTLVQTSSARTLVLPPGTTLSSGRCLVVSRSVGRDAFEAFWGVSLPPGTAYVDGGAVLPVLNGDETLRLVDPLGATADGPTPPLIPGRAYARIPGLPASGEDSWVISAAAPGSATPGAAPDPALRPPLPWISEVVDPAGPGQYPYEFIEIRLD